MNIKIFTPICTYKQLSIGQLYVFHKTPIELCFRSLEDLLQTMNYYAIKLEGYQPLTPALKTDKVIRKSLESFMPFLLLKVIVLQNKDYVPGRLKIDNHKEWAVMQVLVEENIAWILLPSLGLQYSSYNFHKL